MNVHFNTIQLELSMQKSWIKVWRSFLLSIASCLSSNICISGTSAETNNVPGRSLSDDVFMLEKRRDIATKFQGYLHVPQEHNSRLSTRCINNLG